MESYLPLINLFTPDFLLEHFELTAVDEREGVFHLHLEELNRHPQAVDKLLSKGFFPTITVQDFPIRGHQAFLHIKRRRWFNVVTNQVVFRDWSLIAKGTRMTTDFAIF